ncbi:MAG: acyl-CoA dehydrogenase family protein [Spirochaetaceae bacterium]
MRGVTAGFLEELYQGSVQKNRIDAAGGRVDEKRVSSFMERYKEIIKPFDPATLEETGTLPQELLGELKELGIFGLTIAQEYGGLGFTLSEYLRVVEEIARSDMALVLVPLAHLSIGVKGIMLFGNQEQKKKYLPLAASGEMIFSYALTEPKIGSDAKNIETTARLNEEGTHYILNGSKTYITNGNYAGGMTVFAQLDPEREAGRLGAFIVERGFEGLSVGKDMPKMGLKVSSTTPIRFKDVRVPVENMIGEPGDGFKIAMNILNYGRLGLGAASAGLMNQSLRDMTKRTESRRQFGVPIREFQLIQEKMVKAKAHAFAARNMTFFTAALLEEDPLMNVAIESSHCKLYGTTRCWDTLYDALQAAGGAGYISTLPYEKRMRDFRVTTIFEGTTEIHSIYPPLTLFRAEGKKLNTLTSPLAKLSRLYKVSRPAGLGRATLGEALLDRAIRTAGRSEAIFKRLLARGMWKFGKKVVGQEFFLRRMTETSLTLFQLVASVAMVRKEYGAEIPESERALLEYLIEEARLVQKRASGKLERSIERVHTQVMKSIAGA